MSFVLRLEQAFDLKGMGLASFVVHDTVETLAAHVDKLSAGKDFDSIEPSVTYLQSTGSQENPTCLILFHPAGGSGYFYHDLFDEELLQTYSILIVESPFLTGELPEETPTIHEIADQYFPAVVQHIDAGQSVIAAGYSFGGLLAWEFSQLLKRENYKVQQVVNIDQPVPAEIRSCGLGKRLSNWLVRLKYPRETLQDLIRIQKIRTHSMLLEDFYRAVEEHYTPSANGLEMTLIRGEIFMAKFELPKSYGWSKISKTLNTVIVSGSHSTLFHERFIGGLRNAFLKSLKPQRSAS